jgi:DnaK suppressor protein
VGEKRTNLSEQELDEFRHLLLEKRRELTQDVASLASELAGEKSAEDSGAGASRAPTHPADVGSDVYEQELSVSKMVRQRDRLQEIDDALRRITAGTYGLCEGTGKPIEPKRLRATPWARYSLEFAKRMEAKGPRVA